MGDKTQMSGIEKRRWRRVYFAFLVEASDGERVLRGRCQRVSVSGLHVYHPEPFPVDRPIRLRFVLPGQERAQEVQGRVFWSRPEDPDQGFLGGMMVVFQHLMPETEQDIRCFVDFCLTLGAEYDHSVLPSEGPEAASDVIPVRFFGADRPRSESYVVNISEGGIFLRTLRPKAPGASVLVDLYLPGTDRVHRVNGRVAWSREPEPGVLGLSGMGVEFLGVQGETAEALRQFVQDFGQESA